MTSPPAPAVRFENITKRFPGALALDDVSLEVRAGSCHALCGENGAGKSTLGRVLAGIHQPDAGRLVLGGEPVRFATPRDALAAGVGMVHQELACCGNLSVAENLCLGAIPSRRGFVRHTAMARRAKSLLDDIGVELDVRRLLGDLPIAQQQLVQVASAVGSGAKVLVFDEATSSLAQADVERLYALIGRLIARGVTCIYVSHRMAELFRLCDTVTVLRDGRHVATRPVEGLSGEELTRMMIGRPVAEYLPPAVAHELGDELLRAEGCSSAGAFTDVSLSLRAGEIVGLAGLVGAGRSEFAEALFGARRLDAGSVRMHGREAHFRNPAAAIRGGLGLVPEDRKRQGLVPLQSAVKNVTLPVLERLSRWVFVRRAAERLTATELLARLSVRGPSMEAPVDTFSGGNQQKVVLARWLAAGSKVLILDEPTRGVDVGAKAEIHALIGALAAQGHAILLISSELPELLSLSARILVLRGGRLVGEVQRKDASQDALLRMMAGT